MDDLTRIKSYWEDQARVLQSDPRATTQDVYMRQIEIDYITEFLEAQEKPLRVLDIGCGNGYSTIMYKQRVPRHEYIGGDYSEEMIRVADDRVSRESIQGVKFEVMDVLRLSENGEHFDLVISDRCLINLGGAINRKKALKEIAKSLVPGGYYLMIENFIEGQGELNGLRQQVGLEDIDVRWHNSFFLRRELEDSVKNYFTVDRFENISSLYYLVTRVVYSKLCELEGREPDYDHLIYKVAAMLPPVGNFGPICACLLKRGGS